jgi:hypothetical protein
MGEHIVDESLEVGGRIREDERHHERFEKTVPRAERGLPFFSFGYADQVVRAVHIQLGEPLYLRQSHQPLANQRKRISILYRDLVEATIVHDEVKRTVALLDEQDGRAGR